MIKKVINTLKEECKSRGIYYAFIMYFSNIISMLRGIRYKLFYMKNIKSSIFFIQSRSKFDIYSKHTRIKIESFVFIRRNTTIRIDHHGKLTIGAKTFINDNCSINCINKIVIGEYTKIGPGVSINDNDHNFRHIDGGRMLTGEVIIGNNVWIGANSVILRGTVIGDNAVIAAGSIVNGEVPRNTVYLSKGERKIVNY